jgi:thiosulfate dehydrogenase
MPTPAAARICAFAALVAAVATMAPACGDEEVPAAELGARRLSDPDLSTSPFNRVSCSTCHRLGPPPGLPPVEADGRHVGAIDAGYTLADSVHRPSWWGGDELRLLDAVNTCLTGFMGGKPLEADEDAARQIYEYLVTISPDPAPPALPVTVVRTIDDLSALKDGADADRGRDIYDRACRRCHGAPHTGEGRIDTRASFIPEDSIAVFGPTLARSAVVEKVRHGRLFHIGGVMPFYSLEVLTDEELADVLSYVGL